MSDLSSSSEPISPTPADNPVEEIPMEPIEDCPAEQSSLADYLRQEAYIFRCEKYVACTKYPFYANEEDGKPPCKCGNTWSSHTEDAKNNEGDEQYESRNENELSYFGNIQIKSGDRRAQRSTRFARLYPYRFDIRGLLTEWRVITKKRPTMSLVVVGEAIETGTVVWMALFQLVQDLCSDFNVVILTPIHNEEMASVLADIIKRTVDNLKMRGDEFQPPALLGVMRWDSVYKREQLHFRGGDERPYDGDGADGYQRCQAIPPYYTHVILASDGRRKNKTSSKRFLQVVSALYDPNNSLFQVVLLMQGNFTMLKYFETEQFVLVMKDTRGAADLLLKAREISQAYSDWQGKFDNDDFQLLCKEAESMGITLNEDNREGLEKHCHQKPQFGVFDPYQETPAAEVISRLIFDKSWSLEIAIQFSIVWNKKDIFKNEISRQNSDLEHSEIVKLFFLAIKSKCFWAVNTLLSIDKALYSEITVHFLKRLYNEVEGAEALHELMLREERVANAIRDDKNLTKKKLKRSLTEEIDEDTPLLEENKSTALYTESPYRANKKEEAPQEEEHGIVHYENEIYMCHVKTLLGALFGLATFPLYDADKPGETEIEKLEVPLSQGIDHIILWAVLNNYEEMVLKLLKICQRPTSMALAASVINQGLSRYIPDYDTETKRSYTEKAGFYEELACDFLGAVSESDPEAGYDLINESQPMMENRRMVWTAQYSGKVKFAATTTCQKCVDREWKSGIKSNYFVLVLTYFCPFLLLLDSIQDFGTWEDDEGERRNVKDEKLCERIKIFYKSAQVKHMIMFIEYLAVLVLMSYGLIFDFPTENMGICEGIATGMIAVMSLVTFLEVMTTAIDLDFWNAKAVAKTTPFFMYNMCIYIFNWLYIALRVSPFDNYTVQRNIFAVLLILYYARILEFLSFYRTFGPHIVVMWAMLKEFLALLVVIPIILIPYGISLQALLYPNIYTFELDNFLRIFEIPYYNLYGELDLEEIMGEKEGCEPNGIDCPLKNPIAAVLHLLFMCVGAILLMNLLIAVFSSVYSQLSAESENLWESHRLPISLDYMFRGISPAPFTLFEQMFIFFKAAHIKLNSDPQEEPEDVEVYTEILDRVQLAEHNSVLKVFMEIKATRVGTVAACISDALSKLQNSVEDLLIDIGKLYRETKKAEEREQNLLKEEAEKQRQRIDKQMAKSILAVGLFGKKAGVSKEEEDKLLTEALSKVNEELTSLNETMELMLGNTST